MKYKIGFGVLIAVIALVTVSGCGDRQSNSSGTAPTLAERVFQQGTIRAGYVVYPPILIKDPNTGELGGFGYEVLEEAARRLGLKVDWVEEVGWGTMVEGLKTDRYDLVGTAVWPTAGRAKVGEFSRPLCYSVLQVWGRKGDSSFASLRDLNSPDVMIATIDGEISATVAQNSFPKAMTLSLPQASQPSQALLNVVSKKADVAFVERYVAEEYLKSNPDSIEQEAGGAPAHFSRNSFMFRSGEPEFSNMINVAIEELLNSGFVEVVISKYDSTGSFIPPAIPYAVPK